MLGAIVGDVAGSPYEFDNYRAKDCELFGKKSRFTDDTVMTIAVYGALKECSGDYSKLTDVAAKHMQFLGRKYYEVGYGTLFKRWLKLEEPYPYASIGNGAGMRISPVAEFANSEEELADLTAKITMTTHNTDEAYKGAWAVALAVYLAKHGASKKEIKRRIEEYYSLDFSYETLVKNYRFNVSCEGTIPIAIFCFLISKNFEDCIRTTISVGGDTDTLCAISCAIAEYYYGIPKEVKDKALSFLTDDLLEIINEKSKIK